jgi:hypothetical protein
MPYLGRIQQAALVVLAERGATYYRGCGWSWSTYTSTERLYESMLKHHVVSVSIVPGTGPRHASGRAGKRIYTLTAAGQAYLLRELERDLERELSDSTRARMTARLEAVKRAEVPA